MDKAFETNSSFHVRQCNTGKVQFLFFKSFLLVLAKVSVWEGDWELGYNSMEFWKFPHFFKFPKFENLRSFGSSWGNSYLPYLLLIMTLFSLVVNRKFCAMVSQYYDHDCLKKFLFFLSLSTALIVKRQSYFGWTLLYLSKMYVVDQA